MDNDRFAGAAKKLEGKAQSLYGNATGDATQEIKGTAKKMLGDAQDAFGKAEDYVKDSYESAQARINDKPLQSAFIALGVGFVLGKLLGLNKA